MGRAQTPQLAKQLLEYALSDRVPLQDKHTPAAALAANSTVCAALWSGIQENWQEIEAEMSGNFVVLDRFVRVSLGRFADTSVEKEIGAFFEKKDTRGYDRGVAVVREGIRGNAAYRERDEGVLEEWLGARGYL